MAHWRVFKFWRMGMTLVTYQVDTVDTIEAAFRWAEERGIKTNKKSGVLFKREGSKHRIYSYKDWQYWHAYDPPDPQPEQQPDPVILLPAPEPMRQEDLFEEEYEGGLG